MYVCVYVCMYLLIVFSGAAPAAYGGFQARDRIGAVATRTIATRDLSRVCNLHHSSRQRRILNPVSKGRGQTRNLMVPSRIR